MWWEKCPRAASSGDRRHDRSLKLLVRAQSRFKPGGSTWFDMLARGWGALAGAAENSSRLSSVGHQNWYNDEPRPNIHPSQQEVIASRNQEPSRPVHTVLTPLSYLGTSRSAICGVNTTVAITFFPETSSLGSRLMTSSSQSPETHRRTSVTSSVALKGGDCSTLLAWIQNQILEVGDG